MKKDLTRSQSLVLETLNGEEALTYEDIAELSGLSYDGVRGRVSELSKMGYKIDKLREAGNTYLMYKEPSSYKRPRDIQESISKRMSSTEDFYGITDFLDKIKNVKVAKKKEFIPNDSDKNAVLLLSDLHFGEVIYSQTDGSLLYDTDVATERMEELVSYVLLELTKEDTSHLTILGLGDIVDGDMIYRNHLFRVEKPAIEQVQDAVSSLSDFIRELTANGVTVEMFNVRGNHGITNYKNLEEDNWDSVVYDMLSLVFKDDDMVNIENFKNSEGAIDLDGRTIVLYHGEKFSSQIKTASGLREFRGMCGKHRLKDGDMIVVGHLHEFGVEGDQGKTLVRNGSLADASEYAFKLNMYSRPMQTLMFFEEDSNYPRFIPIELEC